VRKWLNVTKFRWNNLYLLATILLSYTLSILTNPSTDQELPVVFSSPYVDNIYFKIVYPEFTAVEKALAGELDTVIGIINPNNVEKLKDFGWNISILPAFMMGFLGINCRDVTPNSSGKYYNYHNRTPGFELYPLNISAFRYALHLLIGDKKDVLIKDVFGITSSRVDTLIPPANKFWYNPVIPQVPYDPSEAYRILTEAGFSNSSGYWVCPNGLEMRQIYVMAIESPPIATLVGKIVDSWNEFFGKRSDGETYYFVFEFEPFYKAVDIIFGNRDHDIHFFAWGLDRSPAYLYDYLHPDTDIEGGYNSPGLNYPPLNDLLWKLKFGRDPATGALLSQSELLTICREAQWLLYYQTPCIPIYSRNYINAYRSGLAGWIESPGYGSAPADIVMPWTYVNIHWQDDPHRYVNWHLNGPVTTLNPGKSVSIFVKTVLNRIYDPLIVVDPYTHEDIAWIVTNLTREFYQNENEGVYNGSKITLWLRRGIYWHDGDPVTADDVVWNFDFIKSIGNNSGFNVLSNVWKHYVRAEKLGEYCLAIYLNTTEPWIIYDLSENALKFPRQIWEPYWGNATSAENFEPWKTPHPKVPGLTSLIGTGPYIFVKWDTIANHIHLHVNRPDYPQDGLPGYWAAWRYWTKIPIPEDINKDFRIDLHDLLLVLTAEDSYPGTWNWLPQADINNNGIINSEDVEAVWKHIIRNYKQLTRNQKKGLKAILKYKIQIQ